MRRSVVDSEAERSALTRHTFFVPSVNAQRDVLLVSADYKKTVVCKHQQVCRNAVSYIVLKLASCRLLLRSVALRSDLQCGLGTYNVTCAVVARSPVLSAVP
jgi:hypothetical protein